jgi:serine/threonine-protein phosphatase 2B catalytic subunit
MASTLFRREPNLIELQDPVTIVGDIHGQFYDMLKLLDLGGNPERTKYVFLGDYVDRGAFSLEVLLVLYALKVNFPNTLFLLRGNHECRQLTTFFSFRKECLYKHDLELYDRCMESFDCMPLACVVDGKFLTVHGGLGPEMVTLADINAISRFQEPPKQGSFCDILWADPYETESTRSAGFRTNDVRGCSYFFTKEAVVPFLKRNDLLSVIRAHEAQLDGFKMYNWNGEEDFPAVITVFSAPNYCDVYNNKGAIIKFENSTLNIQQFNYTQHPYCLPDFMDVFAWSLPFVLDRVSEILLYVMAPGSSSDGELTRDAKRFQARCGQLCS